MTEHKESYTEEPDVIEATKQYLEFWAKQWMPILAEYAGKSDQPPKQNNLLQRSMTSNR